MRRIAILGLLALAACEQGPRSMRWAVCYEYGRAGVSCEPDSLWAPTREQAVEKAAVRQAQFRTFRYFVACEDRLPAVTDDPPTPTPLPDDVRWSHYIIDSNSMPECPTPKPAPSIWVRILGVFTATDAGAVQWPYADPDPSPTPVASFTGCTYAGSSSNMEGYQTIREFYDCDQGKISVAGKWSDTIEGRTLYHTSLGRLDREPESIGDPESYMQRSFQKWCPGRFGMELCGIKNDRAEATPSASPGFTPAGTPARVDTKREAQP